MCAGGLTNNEQFFGRNVSISNAVTADMRNVLFDPQTSGGLLLFCHQDDSQALLATFRAEQITAVEIGVTLNAAEHLLTVT
jgi:selenide,water dikinase